LRVKKIFWLVGGMCAAAAGFLAWGVRRSEQVEDLGQRMDEAERDQAIPGEPEANYEQPTEI
jgi:hypothetical protein